MPSLPRECLVLPAALLPDPPLPTEVKETFLLLIWLARPSDRWITPPVSREELAAHRHRSVRTIDQHLHLLRERQIIANAPGRGGRKLVLVLLSLMEREPGEAKPQSTAAQSAAAQSPAATPPAATPPPSPPLPRVSAADAPAAPSTGADDSPLPFAAGPQPVAGLHREGELVVVVNTPQDPGSLLEATYRAILKAGVYPQLARRLASQPWVTLDLVRAWVQSLSSARGVRHVGAVLASVLQQPETAECAPMPTQLGRSPTEPDGTFPEGADNAECDPPPEPPEEGPCASGMDSDPGGGHADPAGTQPSSAHAWARVLDVLRQTIGEQRVAVYLRDSGPLSCEDGTLVVAVHSTLAQDWLESRHYAALCAAVEQVTGQRLRLRLVARRLRPL